MRYHITTTTAEGRHLVTHKCSSLKEATKVYTDSNPHPGDRVELVDMKTGKALRSYTRPTKEEVAAMRKREVDRLIEARLAARTEIEDFANKVLAALDTTNPETPFRWALPAFQALANYQIGLQLRELREHGRSLDEMHAFFYDRMLRGAKHPEHSTSIVNNLVHEYQTAACAEMTEALFNVINWKE